MGIWVVRRRNGGGGGGGGGEWWLLMKIVYKAWCEDESVLGAPTKTYFRIFWYLPFSLISRNLQISP